MTIPPPATLRHTPLFDRHRGLGAKTADFGGWEMPIEYGGVLAEHAAVREDVGLFDVSHLGKVTVRGPGAAAFVNACLTNDLDRIGAGEAQYTLCCAESGGVVDDLIAYRYSDDDLLLVPNAANAAEVAHRLAAAAPAGVEVADRHEEYGVLAVQGPRSAEVLDRLGLPYDLGYMQFTVADSVVVCRTGYTGEHGYELLPAWDRTVPLWDAVTALGVRPCGLGARDTLRTEMGYPLHGHELSLDITPLQARAGWAVGWDKPAFWGRAALRAERAAGPSRRLWGLVARDRAIPRAGMTVLDGAGTAIGTVTSGTFSPTRRVGIALALLHGPVAEGDEVQVDVRGRRAAAEVVVPPFVGSSVR